MIETLKTSATPMPACEPPRRCNRELNQFSETPRHPGVIRLQSADEIHRVRIGDLRLLFSVEDQVLLVLIVKIGQQGSVYCA